MYIELLNLEIKDFSASDVNMEAVNKASFKESGAIFKNDKEDRDFSEVSSVNRQSLVAEQHLIDMYGFENDDRKYMDLTYNGITIDVKTSSKDVLEGMDLELAKLSKRKSSGNMNVADYVIGFDVSDDFTYTCKYFEKIPVYNPNRYHENNLVVTVLPGKPKCEIRKTVSGLLAYLSRKQGETKALEIMKETYGREIQFIS